MPVNSFEDYPMSWRPQKAELEKPYYLSIAAGLEADILSGKLPENTKLPPQRELADFLDLNLSTITRAYKLCELKGLLYAVTGRGTFVSPGTSARNTFLEKDGGIIEMGMIKPFYENNHTVRDAARLILDREESIKLFEYSNPLGTDQQIAAARKWLRRIGVHAGEKNILLSAGAQNALSVILISLFKAGDKIAVDSFTYTNFKELANFLHIQLLAVPGDEYGMSPEGLLAVCKNTEIKGVYLMPTCSNPTSIFMPQSRRMKLAEIIRRFQLLVIEDDIYSFLSAYGHILPDTKPFFSLVPEQTIHICSISKSLCAGLRVAFIAFPDRYRELLVSGMLGINLKTVSLNSEIIAELIESGEAENIVKQKVLSARKRNRLFQSVFPSPQTDPVTRFFHWLPLPSHLTSEELELLALQKGVHVLGSHRFAMLNENKSSYVRVSVASPDTEDDLKKGLLILKNIFEEKRMDFFV
ncbi:MAG: PLP-dependent aminotransferase family protein [Lachnospiraceae bacterium]|nr:PLP-dependent aminotransferase family protein [Lachnospiraceae bacterium]